MIFRQPNDLARAINFLLDQMQAGESIELILTQRGQDARVRQHLVEVVSEVARQRQVSVEVTEK